MAPYSLRSGRLSTGAGKRQQTRGMGYAVGGAVRAPCRSLASCTPQGPMLHRTCWRVLIRGVLEEPHATGAFDLARKPLHCPRSTHIVRGLRHRVSVSGSCWSTRGAKWERQRGATKVEGAKEFGRESRLNTAMLNRECELEAEGKGGRPRCAAGGPTSKPPSPTGLTRLPSRACDHVCKARAITARSHCRSQVARLTSVRSARRARRPHASPACGRPCSSARQPAHLHVADRTKKT